MYLRANFNFQHFLQLFTFFRVKNIFFVIRRKFETCKHIQAHLFCLSNFLIKWSFNFTIFSTVALLYISGSCSRTKLKIVRDFKLQMITYILHLLCFIIFFLRETFYSISYLHAKNEQLPLLYTESSLELFDFFESVHNLCNFFYFSVSNYAP